VACYTNVNGALINYNSKWYSKYSCH